MSGDSHSPPMQRCGMSQPITSVTGAKAPASHLVLSNGVSTLRASNSLHNLTPHRVCDATASVNGRSERPMRSTGFISSFLEVLLLDWFDFGKKTLFFIFSRVAS
jgi:hypothetical protein